jgi:hypothetical protein
MQYILAAHTDEDGWRSLTREQQVQGTAAFAAYLRDLAKAGVLVGNYRPEPSAAAKTVRFVNGGAEIQDGPFAQLDQQMTGLYVLDVPDEDTALLWAERHPAARIGAIEVRPVSRPGPCCPAAAAGSDRPGSRSPRSCRPGR